MNGGPCFIRLAYLKMGFAFLFFLNHKSYPLFVTQHGKRYPTGGKGNMVSPKYKELWIKIRPFLSNIGLDNRKSVI